MFFFVIYELRYLFFPNQTKTEFHHQLRELLDSNKCILWHTLTHYD